MAYKENEIISGDALIVVVWFGLVCWWTCKDT